ncbi:hypothetical protein RRG08_034811 [Elysia crispata]|uniref:Uncharacterized protein n=1 Tax=Elysia crispata TaxID=231223 RepID=A0AAE1E185_9GAST|nr:hypothetical protein RRG08_034811 [Elysia crispata]
MSQTLWRSLAQPTPTSTPGTQVAVKIVHVERSKKHPELVKLSGFPLKLRRFEIVEANQCHPRAGAMTKSTDNKAAHSTSTSDSRMM